MAGGIDKSTGPAEIFEQHRPLLYSIASDILGTEADAERLVEEILVLWLAYPHHAVEDARTLLVVTIASMCVHRLECLQQPNALQEPGSRRTINGSLNAAELNIADSVSAGCLAMLNSLSPLERVTFLLRIVFKCDYSQIARAVGKNETQCRRMVQRIKGQMVRNRPNLTSPGRS